jgi:hypothetical protein
VQFPPCALQTPFFKGDTFEDFEQLRDLSDDAPVILHFRFLISLSRVILIFSRMTRNWQSHLTSLFAIGRSLCRFEKSETMWHPCNGWNDYENGIAHRGDSHEA